MHRATGTTLCLLDDSPTDPHHTAHNLTQAHTMGECTHDSSSSIMQCALSTHATHAFSCTYLSKESAKQPASPLSSRHVLIANDDTKQL